MIWQAMLKCISSLVSKWVYYLNFTNAVQMGYNKEVIIKKMKSQNTKEIGSDRIKRNYYISILIPWAL